MSDIEEDKTKYVPQKYDDALAQKPVFLEPEDIEEVTPPVQSLLHSRLSWVLVPLALGASAVTGYIVGQSTEKVDTIISQKIDEPHVDLTTKPESDPYIIYYPGNHDELSSTTVTEMQQNIQRINFYKSTLQEHLVENLYVGLETTLLNKDEKVKLNSDLNLHTLESLLYMAAYSKEKDLDGKNLIKGLSLKLNYKAEDAAEGGDCLQISVQSAEDTTYGIVTTLVRVDPAEYSGNDMPRIFGFGHGDPLEKGEINDYAKKLFNLPDDLDFVPSLEVFGGGQVHSAEFIKDGKRMRVKIWDRYGGASLEIVTPTNKGEITLPGTAFQVDR